MRGVVGKVKTVPLLGGGVRMRVSLQSTRPHRRRLEDFREQVAAGPSLAEFIAVAPKCTSPSPRRADQHVHAPIVEHVGEPALNLSPRVKEPLEPARHPALLDSFGRFHNYLRISVTERCNLRCTYCMPADGVPLQPSDRLLSADEIVRVAEVFVGMGVDKIRLTGGEPLVRKDLAWLTRALRGLGVQEVAVTTNGVHPPARYDELVDAGITQFNISLDTLQAEKFARITRRPGKLLKTVLGNMYHLLERGLGGRVKVNNVIMRGVNDDELVDFVMLTRDRPLDVRFIEWMPFDSNGWNDRTFFSYKEIIARITDAFPRFARDVDGPNDTTKWYRAADHIGRVGFISSMSQHFCGDCNRLRITADGKLKVCLFGEEGLSLRDAVRGGKSIDELQELIASAVGRKKAVLGGRGDMYGLAKSKNRPMILIGG